MRTTTAGEITILGARQNAFALKVEIKDDTGAYVAYDSLSSLDWQDRCEITQDVNQRVAQATIHIAREANGNSLAPLINADIDAGRDIRISGSRVAVGSAASFKVLFQGVIDTWDCAADPMVLVARDDMGELVDRWVEDETVYGTEAGRAIESVMQDILDDWAPSSFTLYTPSSPSFLVTTYRQQKESVLDALQTLADLIGWVLEYRWDDGTSAFRLTFYVPTRAPGATAWTFGANDYYDVTKLAVSRHEIRNAVTVRYTDSATGARSAYNTESAASIADYGRLWMEIEESDESPIDSDAEATTMAAAALSDLASPVAEQEIETDLFWPIQLGDYDAFTANNVHYDVDQSFAVTGFSHVFEGGGALTLIQTRGAGAVSHTRGWIKRERRERPDNEVAKSVELLNFREISRTSTTIKYGWTLGSDLSKSLIHDYKESQPYSSDKWPSATRLPDSISSDRSVEYTVNIPEQGQVRYFQVEGRRSDGTLGDVERVLVFPANIAGDYIAFASCTVNQTDGSVKIAGWTTDRALSVAYAYNVGTAGATSPPTETQAEAQGTGATGGGLVTSFTSDFEISLAASTVGYGQVIKGLLIAYINANGTGPDGTATDHDTPVGFQGERFKITASDQITDGVVIASKLTEGQRNFNTDVVFSGTDWDTVAWTAGTLTLSNGTSYSIASGNTGNLASDAVRWIYFSSTVSTTVLQVTTTMATATGEGVVLLCVAKRAAGGSASGQIAFFVPAIGTFGINADVIGANSITTVKITDDAITAPKIVANAITTDKLNANAVTAAKIAALTITAAELAAGAVTAAKINVASLSAIVADCGTITAGTISTSVLIAANTFTASTATFSGTIELSHATTGTISASSGDLELTTPNDATLKSTAGGTVTLSASNVSIAAGAQNLGFHGATPVAKQPVTGSRGGNAALASLFTALATLGLVVDSSS